MARRRLNAKAMDYKGETVVWSTRLPKPLSDFMESKVGLDGLVNRSTILQDAAGLWALLESDDHA
jgi:hypothetical protein